MLRAIRSLWRDRGFAAAAICTLALGIGANSAVFSVLNAVLLQPLPYAEPDRLAVIWTDDPKHDVHEEGTSYPNFLDWRARNHSFSDMAVTARDLRLQVTQGGEVSSVFVSLISPNLFSVLGVKTAVGRVITEAEDAAGAPVGLISTAAAKRRFGTANAVGRHVAIEGVDVTVIGVMPANFDFFERDNEFWITASATPMRSGLTDRWSDDFRVVGRLRPGVTMDDARADLKRIGASLAIAYPPPAALGNTFAGFETNVVPMLTQITGTMLPRLLWLLAGAVGLVLAIAGANLANLLLIRGQRKSQDVAVRLSLGATTNAIARQLLTETAVLAVGSIAIGMALAYAIVKSVIAFGPSNIPRLNETAVDWRTFGIAAAAALVGGLLASLAPLYHVLRHGAANVQRASSRSVAGSRGRLQATLIITQLALSVALLGTAGVFLRSFWSTLTADLGITRDGILLAEVQTPNGTRASTTMPEAIRRVADLPGVTAAGALQDFFIVRNPQARLLRDGKAEVQGPLTRDYASPGYFPAAGTRLLSGRYLEERDYVPRGGNVVIDETVAKRYWPGEDAVGQSFRGTEGAPPNTVVGVVANVRRGGIDRDPPGQIFYPGYAGRMTIAARLRQAAPGITGQIQQELRRQGLILPREPRMIEAALSEQTAPRRFYGMVMAGFAALAVLLAALGVYGVVQYSVLQRRRELGVRMAVGATAQDVLRLVLSQGLRYASIGVVTGLVGFLALGGVLDSLLFGVHATDPFSIAAAGAVLFLATLAACWFPARQAVSIHPSEALRPE